jgi:TolA-binding protein
MTRRRRNDNKHMNHRLPIIALMACLSLIPIASTAQWTWKLEAERYGALNLFERAQYDKAKRLFEEKDYRAAAAEFEKFKVQFPDSAALSYVLFMRGFSFHHAKDRNEAIKVYNEVMDFFGDVVADAAPALFYLGIAHLENGDTRAGLEAMLEVVEDEDYQKHPVAAGALRRLADNKWRNGEQEAAVVFWKQAVRDFGGSNPDEANAARYKVTDFYIKSRNYSGYEKWLLNDENRDDPKHRKWVAELAWGRAWNNFHTEWGKYTNFNREEKKQDVAAFYAWFKAQKAWYDKADDGWRFYYNAIYFVSQRMGDRAETRRLIDELAPQTQALASEADRNARYAWLADRMREAADWTSAEYCISKMTDALSAEYKRYEMAYYRSQWDAAIAHLEALEKANSQSWSPRALGAHAALFKDRLGRYEEAIVLYRKINNPPANLWAIQECYYRWGKLQEALTTLNEIENSFPDSASRAAWHKASYYHAAGRSTEAVAAARRVLKMYPKSPESSKAHQLLEGYGIATGGGVLDEN